MIQHRAIADETCTTLDDLDQLLRGQGTARLERLLGVRQEDISGFIHSGRVSAALASRLNLEGASASELGAVLKRDGRIGLLFGLLFSTAPDKD
jgi:hypothetical protein